MKLPKNCVGKPSEGLTVRFEYLTTYVYFNACVVSSRSVGLHLCTCLQMTRNGMKVRRVVEYAMAFLFDLIILPHLGF